VTDDGVEGHPPARSTRPSDVAAAPVVSTSGPRPVDGGPG